MIYFACFAVIIVGYFLAIFCLYQVLASVRCTKRIFKELRSAGFTVDKKADKSTNLTIAINIVIIAVVIVLIAYFFTNFIESFFVGFILGFLTVYGKTKPTEDNLTDVMRTYGQFIKEKE